jgi:hypothetical protein
MNYANQGLNNRWNGLKSRIFLIAGQRLVDKQTIQIHLKDGTFSYA